jgi:hypothetical protein
VLYDLASERLAVVSPAGVVDSRPALHGGDLVWQRHTASGWEVWHRDLARGLNERLAGPFAAAGEPRPVVSAGRVAWVQGPKGNRAVALGELAPAGNTTANVLPRQGSVRGEVLLAGYVAVWVEETPSNPDGGRLIVRDLASEKGNDVHMSVPMSSHEVSLSPSVVAWPDIQNQQATLTAYDVARMTRATIVDGLPVESFPGPLTAGDRIVSPQLTPKGSLQLYLA